MNTEEMEKICKEIEELLKRKNEMYGDNNIDKMGKEGVIMRITEKIEKTNNINISKLAEEIIEKIKC